MNILEEIVAHKKQEIQKESRYYKKLMLDLERQNLKKCVSIKESIQQKYPSIIAEFKKKSPSKGVIHANAEVKKIVKGYTEAGARAISVLTNNTFFAGTKDDLLQAKKITKLPVLRKEFIISKEQIYESKLLQADAILLIASILSKKQIEKFTQTAHKLEMEVILEIHEIEEIEKIYDKVDILGVNNRNLKKFHIDIMYSEKMIEKLPKDIIKISESGLDNTEKIHTLFQAGYSGFLIGEAFMKTTAPEKTCKNFIQAIKKPRFKA